MKLEDPVDSDIGRWTNADAIDPALLTQQDDALDALRSVALVLKPLRRVLAARALEARADGQPWHAIADALGLEDPGDPASRAAYEVVKAARGGGGWWCDLHEVVWTCRACGADVVDEGPDAHELGHDEACARRRVHTRHLAGLP